MPDIWSKFYRVPHGNRSDVRGYGIRLFYVKSIVDKGRRIRQIDRNVPLLFLTAKSEIDDIVEGFELGGNDCLKKPFKMLELIVRIKALLRRNCGKEDNQFEIGDYTLDLSAQILSHKDNGGIE